MRVKFWGVRGSIPSPLTPSQIESKIAAVVQRIQAKDIKNQDSREKFLASLPKWLFGTIGANTSCVEVETAKGHHIIFDAGTGIRELGIDLTKRPDYGKNNIYHLFISHFHWDHIQGLPFFNPAYDPRSTIIVHSTRKDCKKFLEEQMKYPYFPISMLGEDGFAANFEFRYIEPNQKYVEIGDAKVGWHRVRHPGGCTAYSVIENGKKIIYSTDTELRPRDFEKNEQNTEFYTDAEMLIIDAQYTLTDSIQKEGWGHSTFSVAIDFASGWNIKRLILFHHEPTYNDKKVFSLKQSADWYHDYSKGHLIDKNIEIFIAQEGRSFLL
ncbi:MBL fold metallo-hydrolase [Treponema pedis]|uniref:Metallo-beta-lactamase n=2 Tax=Treponema pedis TaxID=409322 RepID=S5ZN75_9SPIR|nr:MBL fold metallo-hydrolase [Treponema pedis]AGT44042.1 metallo-beta-lactamase [Treponema pedis str. T A4]QOW61879.1 MBL fold metallo-hydrolase [Treponema pedis]QSI04766.1 MBL fold metallo-hydrolase [Treponema pedis]